MGTFVLRKDIHDFLFPCQTCGTETFHVVAEEHAGFTVGVIFRKKPLFSTQRANQVICCRCKTINARLDDESVSLLANGYIPKKIHERYPKVAQFYTVDMLQLLQERLKDDPETLAEWQASVRAYRLEL